MRDTTLKGLPMSGWSIRRRLLTALIGATAAVLFVTAVLILTASVGIVDDQIARALVGESEALAATLDSEFRSLETTVVTLAALMDGQDESAVTRLWQPATRLMRDPNSPIVSVGVMQPLRDSLQILVFSRPTSPTAIAPYARYLQAAPSDAWLATAYQSEALAWYDVTRPTYRQGGEAVFPVATPFYRRSGEQAGIVWIDISRDRLTQLSDDLLRLQVGRSLRGYQLVTDANGAILLGFNLPDALGGRTPDPDALRADLDALGLIAQTFSQEADTFLTGRDPFSTDADADAYLIRSPIPTNGWSLVNILPDTISDNPVSQTAFQIALLALLALSVAAWLLSNFISSAVSEPLLNMATAAQEIGSGDMRYQIGYLERDDEVGRLARALDDMKNDLAQSYDELALWSRRLERRVSERTAELEQARTQAQAAARDLQSVYDASLSVVSELYLQIVLQKLAERARDLLRARYVGVWIITTDARQLQLVATTSPDKGNLTQMIPVDTGLAGRAVQTLSVLVVPRYLDWEGRLGFIDATITQAMSAPLVLSGEPLGALVIGRGNEDDAFDAQDERLLTLLANIVSPVVRNAQLYAQVNNAQQQAERANQVKTRFLASITHELRTPLNLIINNMDFMRVGVFGDVNEDQVARLDQTIRSAEHLLYLINDLLDVSKIEAGEMQLFFQPVDLTTVIHDALDSAQAQMERLKPVHITTSLPPELPLVTADARRVRQVLLNLLTNAVKFTPEGDVTLTVSADAERVTFTVSDTGIGIPADDIALIFEPFERSKPSRQQNIEGTGLGLPISRHLVEAHGGALTVESTVGVGSTFTFWLPLARPQTGADAVTPQPAAFLSGIGGGANGSDGA